MTTTNPLLHAFVILAKEYKKELTPHVLTQDIPMNNHLSQDEIFSQKNQGLADIFSRVTQKAGFSSTLVKNITLKKIPKLFFPTILLLKEDRFCILTQLNKSRSHAKIIFPEISKEESYWVEIKELEKEFTGSFFLLKSFYKSILK